MFKIFGSYLVLYEFTVLFIAPFYVVGRRLCLQYISHNPVLGMLRQTVAERAAAATGNVNISLYLMVLLAALFTVSYCFSQILI